MRRRRRPMALAAALATLFLLPAAGHATTPVRAHTAAEGDVRAADLLAAIGGGCADQLSRGKYRTDDGTSADIPVCGKQGAVYWHADMDIDCDGQPTGRCNKKTDRWFQPETAFQQSDGRHLNSAALPFIVVPLPSRIWDHRGAGVGGGTIAAVIHKDEVQYAVVGDQGPKEIIGEASYASAAGLGIAPDPTTGGVDSGVTYLLFPGSAAHPIEDHGAAVAEGEALAKRFLAEN
ncbi:glycoside hydrolase family 75 protein [Streptomyces boninensis]|uniref:glycoside hydrolase family 75 protein n=1 Tax=Streptomyces boninensis TaxID=2039455 RepID=UPI003B211753